MKDPTLEPKPVKTMELPNEIDDEDDEKINKKDMYDEFLEAGIFDLPPVIKPTCQKCSERLFGNTGPKYCAKCLRDELSDPTRRED